MLLTPYPGCGLSELNRPADLLDSANAHDLDLGGGSAGFGGRSLAELLRVSRGWLVKLTDFGVSATISVFQSNELVSW